MPPAGYSRVDVDADDAAGDMGGGWGDAGRAGPGMPSCKRPCSRLLLLWVWPLIRFD